MPTRPVESVAPVPTLVPKERLPMLSWLLPVCEGGRTSSPMRMLSEPVVTPTPVVG